MEEVSEEDYEYSKKVFREWAEVAIPRRYLPTKIAQAVNTLIAWGDRLDDTPPKDAPADGDPSKPLTL